MQPRRPCVLELESNRYSSQRLQALTSILHQLAPSEAQRIAGRAAQVVLDTLDEHWQGGYYDQNELVNGLVKLALHMTSFPTQRLFKSMTRSNSAYVLKLLVKVLVAVSPRMTRPEAERAATILLGFMTKAKDYEIDDLVEGLIALPPEFTKGQLERMAELVLKVLPTVNENSLVVPSTHSRVMAALATLAPHLSARFVEPLLQVMDKETGSDRSGDMGQRLLLGAA